MIKEIKLKLNGGYFDIVTGNDYGLSSSGVDCLEYVKDGVWHIESDPCTVCGEAVITVPMGCVLEKFGLDIIDGAFGIERVAAEKIYINVNNSAGTVTELYGRKISVSVGKGSVRATRCDTDMLSVDCGYGSVDMNLVKDASDCTVLCRHGMGEVTYNSQKLARNCKVGRGSSRIEIICGRGNVNIAAIKR